jgi:hypothetical protein
VTWGVEERDPLLDAETRAALLRRGQQALGLALLGAGIALSALLWSYDPADPAWHVLGVLVRRGANRAATGLQQAGSRAFPGRFAPPLPPSEWVEPAPPRHLPPPDPARVSARIRDAIRSRSDGSDAPAHAPAPASPARKVQAPALRQQPSRAARAEAQPSLALEEAAEGYAPRRC